MRNLLVINGTKIDLGKFIQDNKVVKYFGTPRENNLHNVG